MWAIFVSVIALLVTCAEVSLADSPNITCGSDEEYNSCANGGCGRWLCSQFDIGCVDLLESACEPGCRCKDPLLRTDDGKCVPSDQCPPPKCGINEDWVECIDSVCRPTTCAALKVNENLPLSCQQPNDNQSLPACNNEGCVCKDGFVRDDKDTCIPTQQCLLNITCGAGEEFDKCASGCGRWMCSQNFTTCPYPVDDSVCVPGCRCKDWKLRTDDGKCVHSHECPQPSYVTCGPDEEYNSCSNGGCGRWMCSQFGILCIDLIPAGCEPGCRCKEPLLRTDDGKCVTSDQCPPPQCGTNEEFVECMDSGCRPEYCSTLKMPLSCEQDTSNNQSMVSCNRPGCTCKEGFVRDDRDFTCIPPEQCPSKIVCEPDEEYNSCANYVCGNWLCSPKNDTVCMDMQGEDCLPGCTCKAPLLKAVDGRCVPSDQCSKPKETKACNPNDEENIDATSEFQNQNGAFASMFLNEAVKNNPGRSVVASPFSVLFLLAQLAMFATGDALQQLNGLLNLNCSQQIRGTIPPYLQSFDSEKDIDLRLVEKVYGSEQYPLSASFKEYTKNVFLSQAQNVDFSNPKEAAKTINDWVASQTNDLIKDLVPESSLSADSRLVLTNAIYFKGNWSKPFKRENTQPKDFYITESKTVTVQMMNQVARFKYGVMPKSQAQVVEIPYVNENLTLLVVLPPKTADAMDNLLTEQLDFTSITSVLSNLQYKKVNISLPSFDTETRTDLMDILKKAGVKQIFNQYDSGLSGILAQPENVSVSYVTQKAKITVDELGSEAAAGNAFIFGVTTAGVIEDPKEFNADHSFLYYLLLRGTPLFCGKFAGPQ